MSAEPLWLAGARDLVGLAEIHGPAHEPEILRLARDAHIDWIRDDETAWCGVLVCGCLERAGIRSTRSAAARSFEHYGVDVLGPLAQIPLGAILVYSRPPDPAHGHVNFAVGYTRDGKIVGLGGNQGDRVSIAPFDTGRLIAARWPRGEALIDTALYQRIPLMNLSTPVSTRES